MVNLHPEDDPFHGDGLPFAWEDLTFSVHLPQKDKTVLNGLTGVALPHRALAIMGASGAGKTSFLSALSDRLGLDKNKNLSLTGNRIVGDTVYSRDYRKMVAFVTQEDILEANSTPAEEFEFSLSVRRGIVDPSRVDSVINQMKLNNCRDTLVGTPGVVAGLSGGERKRTNIGNELITEPFIFMLDEPTSGLDSDTGRKVVKLCQQMAHSGRTVMYVIHQPTAEMLKYFDDLMLLAQGKDGGEVVYHGPMDKAVEYFAALGYHCPADDTPTDFFMSLLEEGYNGASGHETTENLLQSWKLYTSNEKKSPYRSIPAITDTVRPKLVEATAAHGSTPCQQIAPLTKRGVREVVRNKPFIIGVVVQNIVLGLFNGLIFLNIKDTTEGVFDRNGLIFSVSINAAFSSTTNSLYVFRSKKAVYLRDRRSDAYSPWMYYLITQLTSLPVHFLGLFIQVTLTYWMAGLHASAANFFMFLLIVNVTYQVGAGLGQAISAAVDDVNLGAIIPPIIIVPLILAGGLTVSTDRIRPYWIWLEKISFPRQAFILLVKEEFRDLDNISCDVAKYGSSFCSRQPKTGAEVLDGLGFNDGHSATWLLWLQLIVLFILVRLLAIGCLYRLK